MSLPRCKDCPQCDCCGNSRDTETYGCSCPPCVCTAVVRNCPPPPPREGICGLKGCRVGLPPPREGICGKKGCRVGLPPDYHPDNVLGGSLKNIGEESRVFTPSITPRPEGLTDPEGSRGITPILAPSITPRPEGLTDPEESRAFTPSITPLYSLFINNENLIFGGLALITIIIIILMFKKFK